jgi:hypothetical protein
MWWWIWLRVGVGVRLFDQFAVNDFVMVVIIPFKSKAITRVIYRDEFVLFKSVFYYSESGTLTPFGTSH